MVAPEVVATTLRLTRAGLGPVRPAREQADHCGGDGNQSQRGEGGVGHVRERAIREAP